MLTAFVYGVMVSLYFGLPGSGKTTYATAIAVKEQKRIEKGISKYKHVYTNFPVFYKGILQLQAEMLGKLGYEESLIIIDEATLIADSRDYKKFSQEMKSFFLMHRHFQCDVVLFTQQWDAVDKKIRVITDHVYYVHKGAFRRWISYANIIPYGIIIPDKKDNSEKYGEIIQGYCRGTFFQRMFAKRIKRRKYYKYFDTFIHEDLPAPPDIEWMSFVQTDSDQKKGED